MFGRRKERKERIGIHIGRDFIVFARVVQEARRRAVPVRR